MNNGVAVDRSQEMCPVESKLLLYHNAIENLAI